MEKKYHVALDDFERRVLMNCLNEMRNRLIFEGGCTEDVDTILLKVIDAKDFIVDYIFYLRYWYKPHEF